MQKAAKKGDADDYNGLIRPCVDCGQRTGCWCDTGTGRGVCLARTKVPAETWGARQATPLCTSCDARFGACHFCRGVALTRPFAWGPK